MDKNVVCNFGRMNIFVGIVFSLYLLTVLFVFNTSPEKVEQLLEMKFLDIPIKPSNGLYLSLLLIPIYHIVSSAYFIVGVLERSFSKILPYFFGTFFMFVFVLGVHLTVAQQIYNPRLWFLVVYWVSCTFAGSMVLKEILIEKTLEKNQIQCKHSSNDKSPLIV